MKGVQDALRRLYGVADVHVELQTNQVTITPATDVELDLGAVPEAIRRAGFVPADMHLVARGTVGERAGASTFRIRGWSTELSVRGELPRSDGEIELRARVHTDGAVVLEPE